jgi:hypothetical protein
MKFVSFLILVGAVSALAAPIINTEIDKRTPIPDGCNGEDQCNGVGNSGNSKGSSSVAPVNGSPETFDPEIKTTDSSSEPPKTPPTTETLDTKPVPPSNNVPVSPVTIPKTHTKGSKTHNTVPEPFDNGFELGNDSNGVDKCNGVGKC